jgi:hypothetical protein
VRHWGGSWANAWGDSWGDATVVVIPVDGSGLIVTRRRKEPPYKVRPEEIARQQREDERYLAELESKAKPQVASEIPPTDMAAAEELAVTPQLPDAIARAASAQQVIARARASSAEALAKVKADERRRTALLLLALD